MGIFTAKPLSYKDIFDEAMALRRTLEIPDNMAFPVLRFIEHVIPLIFPEFNFKIVKNHELPDSYASTNPLHGVLSVREEVYVGATRDSPRDRFTIAHELGHLILHGPESIVFHRKENMESIKAYENPEWQANVFAAALLMPPDNVINMTVEEIRQTYKVSKTAAEFHLKNVKKQYGEKM